MTESHETVCIFVISDTEPREVPVGEFNGKRWWPTRRQALMSLMSDRLKTLSIYPSLFNSSDKARLEEIIGA